MTASPAEKAPTLLVKPSSPLVEARTALVKALGMELSSLTDETRKTFAIDNTVASGVVVTHVDPGSAAAATGITAGYVIRYISVGNNLEPVNDAADVEKTMQALKRADKKSASIFFSNPNGYERGYELFFPQ